MSSLDLLTLAFVAIVAVCVCVAIGLAQWRLREQLRYRSANIVAHGWPPVHCDADGDPIDWDQLED